VDEPLTEVVAVASTELEEVEAEEKVESAEVVDEEGATAVAWAAELETAVADASTLEVVDIVTLVVEEVLVDAAAEEEAVVVVTASEVLEPATSE
jgi:hypothetical protein